MIQSNYESVEEIATKMEKASDSIRGATIKSISAAEKTTLNVNESSLDTNKKAINLMESFHEEFNRMIQDIQSTAAEFERTDNEISQSMDNLIPSIDFSKDFNTYNKAKYRWLSNELIDNWEKAIIFLYQMIKNLLKEKHRLFDRKRGVT